MKQKQKSLNWYCVQYVLKDEKIGYMQPLREKYFKCPDIETAQALVDSLDIKVVWLSQSEPKNEEDSQ